MIDFELSWIKRLFTAERRPLLTEQSLCFHYNFEASELRSAENQKIQIVLLIIYQMLSKILGKLNCCKINCDEDLLASEENFLAPGDHQEQNSRLKPARQPYHPAIQRSGMRFDASSSA